MRCKSCDYPLWNLTARRCPECGDRFAPSDFEFAANSVQFCCPHCDQPYYGTTETGHLFPHTFDCVNCGQRVDMDRMVLRPTTGLEERQTRAGYVPWLERERDGRIKSWFKTIWLAMMRPQRLMKATPPQSPTRRAWWFAVVTCTLTTVASFLPSICLMGIMLPFAARSGGGTGPTTGMMMGLMGSMFGVMGIFLFLFLLGYAGLWGLVVHGLLKITGDRAAGIGRTFQAICYSSGAVVSMAVPCIGGLGAIWWVVSAVLMVKEGQRVSGKRAAFVVLAFPVVSIVLVIGGYALLVAVMMSQPGFGSSPLMVTPSPPASAQSEIRLMASALQGYALSNNNTGPGHALQLLGRTAVVEWDFFASNSETVPDAVQVGGGTMDDFLDATDVNQKWQRAQAAADALPANVIAHRIGDYVFTYHGIDFTAGVADARLWAVLRVFDPDAVVFGTATNDPIWIGHADGSISSVTRSQFAASLAVQNRVRASHGLPTLPDPSTVTHGEPATSD